MHRSGDVQQTLQALFIAANVVIFAGYMIIPFVFLRYIRLDRRTILAGGGFFSLCGLTHLGMAAGHSHVPLDVWWTLQHLAQAVCTWAFILLFARLLSRADEYRRDRRPAGPGHLAGGDRPAGPAS